MEMDVLVKLNATVDVTPAMGLKVVLEELGFKMPKNDFYMTILEANDRRNPKHVKGIFRAMDISYHGSPCWEYKLISTDESKIKDFELAHQLYKNFKDKEIKL